MSDRVVVVGEPQEREEPKRGSALGGCFSFFFKLVFWAALLLSVGLVGFAIGTNYEDVSVDAPAQVEEVTADSQKEQPAQTPVADGKSPASAIPHGEVGTATDGITIAIESVEYNADAFVASASQANASPGAGNRYILVTMRLGNTGEEAREFSILEFDVVGERGTAYDNAVVLHDDMVSGTELFPGGNTLRSAAFEVPVGETGFTLIYSPSLSNRNRLFLQLPPE